MKKPYIYFTHTNSFINRMEYSLYVHVPTLLPRVGDIIAMMEGENPKQFFRVRNVLWTVEASTKTRKKIKRTVIEVLLEDYELSGVEAMEAIRGTQS